jgi:hypothetical protein
MRTTRPVAFTGQDCLCKPWIVDLPLQHVFSVRDRCSTRTPTADDGLARDNAGGAACMLTGSLTASAFKC